MSVSSKTRRFLFYVLFGVALECAAKAISGRDGGGFCVCVFFFFSFGVFFFLCCVSPHQRPHPYFFRSKSRFGAFLTHVSGACTKIIMLKTRSRHVSGQWRPRASYKLVAGTVGFRFELQTRCTLQNLPTSPTARFRESLRGGLRCERHNILCRNKPKE